jgi:hypothetical protein
MTVDQLILELQALKNNGSMCGQKIGEWPVRLVLEDGMDHDIVKVIKVVSDGGQKILLESDC